MAAYDAARMRMVRHHLAARGLHDARVLAAMAQVPRERFVAPGMAEFAYEDSPLPIGEGQTISQPYIVALMLEAARIRPADLVLEVGTGSGYAAALMSRLARHVHTVERHASLAEEARARFVQLEYDNIDVHIGDGSRGWPDAAPFDAILVAAGAPAPPEALRSQLAIGGRLVIPVGDEGHVQELLKIRRTGEDTFEQESLGAVTFVPLIGEQGWAEDGRRAASRHVPARARGHDTASHIAGHAIGLPDVGDDAFADAFDRFADARVVLLGECSHGTSEFYAARAAITRRLVERHGFTLVAVEADWPDASVINRHVRHLRPRPHGPVFARFPTWMWRNREIAALTGWMRRYNEGRAYGEQVGFYGLDIYSLNASIEAVLEYLDRTDPEAAVIARERYGCLTPWQRSPEVYGRAALRAGHALCEDAVVRQCRELLDHRLGGDDELQPDRLDAAQNARLVASAERYYRVMYYGGADSWNLRDEHMADTLDQLLRAHGPDSRAVVWAHNSHIGDARHTDMGQARGEHNIGQLVRQRHSGQAALIGFGTHTGTVAAAHDWGDAMEIMDVRPSRAGSIERLCHDAGRPRFLLDLREGHDETLRRLLSDPLLQRFIGVIYRPETELQSHYARASLARQYDGYVWLDETRAVDALPARAREADEVPDTYPFGV
ncbi:protein-L-isoaspartate(D-aspartate) O-methyltransferase [Lysobacter arvi]|uniref:Protein-L-isoaspartate O-methyltransferase n=1 Tax=Lysobacter arvi TaxID=3038776 RepID=A0ABU1CH77_9GAMM|nr:protein-L-isoaspartate(D-aspartate) O-methyltransferase [Lysobacter arvi]MDR0184301.1 protein-L-isoaspartate(D-aspartate) O-methyltransferase [Lysobacter arvi]